jgi:hypothetical protein
MLGPGAYVVLRWRTEALCNGAAVGVGVENWLDM